MIKINISEEQKEKIEKIIWNDAITASTGILKELNKNRSAQFWNDSDKFHKFSRRQKKICMSFNFIITCIIGISGIYILIKTLL